jgi:phosphinothricin acetyltransferase
VPNPRSAALHEKLGFTLTGTQRGIGHKQGVWYDVEFWQRDLASRLDDPPEPGPR